MQSRKRLLLIDAIINLVLGVLLVFFPESIVALLGVPAAASAFYPSILGAILFGIGLALFMERNGRDGLGLYGAVAINLSGGLVLGAWLVFGGLDLPLRGTLVLWGLVVLLVCIGTVEMLAKRETR